MKSILMVCRGNICRSPIAEGYFQHQLNIFSSSINVSSAGITAMVDHPADPNALSIMKTYGMDISSHRARQLTDKIIKQSNLILVMTQSQLNAITRQYVSAKGKTFLLGHWSAFEIRDPYMHPYEAFEKVYQQVEQAWQDWKNRILPC